MTVPSLCNIQNASSPVSTVCFASSLILTSAITTVIMPEIGEIARIVNRLRTHLVGKTILSVTAFEDTIVYKDTTHDAFKKALEGKKVLAAKQWGKYFWYGPVTPIWTCLYKTKVNKTGNQQASDEQSPAPVDAFRYLPPL